MLVAVTSLGQTTQIQNLPKHFNLQCTLQVIEVTSNFQTYTALVYSQIVWRLSSVLQMVGSV